MQNPRNLKVWHKARELAGILYRFTATLPTDERFGLVTQMRRAAVSVGSNISEGCSRLGDRELIGYLRIALGSATELEFQLLVTADMALGDTHLRDEAVKATEEAKRMLARLIIAITAKTGVNAKEGVRGTPSKASH